MNKKITELRLQKEQQSLQKEPHEQALVTRTEHLTFHFCLFGLEEDFMKGYYHVMLQLPQDYPFSPPKIRFITQNGRFEVGKPICTTFTHYHKETWSSSWNIRTIITALISFMYSNQKGIGGVFDSPSRRKNLAKKSLANNIGNPLFVSLFKQKMIHRKLTSRQQFEQIQRKSNDKDQKNKKQKKQSLTSSSQLRDEEQQNISVKSGGSFILNVAEQLLKVKLQRLNNEQQNYQDIQPKKHKGLLIDDVPIFQRVRTSQKEQSQS